MKDKVVITDRFWLRYRDNVREQMIPYQWRVLNDEADISIEKERDADYIPVEKSHALENFRIAAGQHEGHHYGWVFQDSDVYKWLEAVAYSLEEKPDAQLQSLADGVVDLIGAAQEPSGYLSTYFTIEEPERKYRNLRESHELYCAGHFLEAAVAYHGATGNKKVLDIACRLADCIDENFGPEDGKIHMADGHEEVEIGLIRLYRATGNGKYLNLAKYFLDIRGVDPDVFKKAMEADPDYRPVIEGMEQFPPKYFQMHKPVREQDTAEGHAVRLVYMCTAMAAAAAEAGDSGLYEAAKRIWNNIVYKRMYITGGIGSTVHGEAFTFDYDLPNDTMYCETCASIGLAFFAKQMLANESLGEYADVMERALYNTALDGMALDGRHFFYVNPLSVNPAASRLDPLKSHVKSVRPEWLGCACCPPNLARMIASVDKYAFHREGRAIYADLFMGCEATFEVEGGTVNIRETTDYPWNGAVTFEIKNTGGHIVNFAFRVPGWSKGFMLSTEGENCANSVENGYAMLQGEFKHARVRVEFDMPVRKCHAHVNVAADRGKTALMRGPLVYCLEEADNGAGLQRMSIDRNARMTYRFDENLLGGVGVIEGEGFIDEPVKNMSVYVEKTSERHRRRLRFIPYFAWANRGENEMTVWVNEV